MIFLRRELAQILVDDVADMLEIDGERHDLHGAAALALVERVARELGDVELDRLVEPVDDIVQARHVAGELAVVGHQRGHDLAQHGLDGVAHAQRLARGIGERERRVFQRRFVEIARHRSVGRLLFLRQQAHQQPGHGVERPDEDRGQRDVEQHVELGRHLRRVGLQRRHFARDRLQERQRDQHADQAIEQVADRQPPARRIAAHAGFEQRIDGAAEIGAEHQRQRRRLVTNCE